MNIRRATIAVFASTIFRHIISFLAIAFFSRKLGVALLGSFFLFQSILSMTSIPVDLGIRIGIEKRLSEGRSPSDTVATGLFLKIILLIVLLVLIYLLRSNINQYIGADVATLLAIALVLQELGQVGRHTLRGEHRVTESSIFQPLRTTVWALAGVLLTIFDFGEVALFWAYITGLFVSFFTIWFLVDTKLGSPSFSRAKSLMGYSKFAMIGSVGGLIYNWTDVILIGFFISQSAVGAYEVAWRITVASLLLSNAVRTSIFPPANELGKKGEIQQLEELVEKAFIPSFYIVIPAVIGGAIVGSDILSLWFAIEFPMIHLVLVILFIEKFQRAFLLPLIAPMHAIGNVNYGAYTTIVGAVVNLAVNLLLIPSFGILGAAIGTTLGASINTLSHAWLLSREINISVPVLQLGRMAIAAVIMGLAVVGIRYLLAPLSMIELGVVIVSGVAIYTIISITFTSIRHELKNTAQSII